MFRNLPEIHYNEVQYTIKFIIRKIHRTLNLVVYMTHNGVQYEQINQAKLGPYKVKSNEHMVFGRGTT